MHIIAATVLLVPPSVAHADMQTDCLISTVGLVIKIHEFGKFY